MVPAGTIFYIWLVIRVAIGWSSVDWPTDYWCLALYRLSSGVSEDGMLFAVFTEDGMFLVGESDLLHDTMIDLN